MNLDDEAPADAPEGGAGDEDAGGGHVDGNNNKAVLGSDGWARFPTVLERYYTSYTLSNHQMVSIHSNGCACSLVIGRQPRLHCRVLTSSDVDGSCCTLLRCCA